MFGGTILVPAKSNIKRKIFDDLICKSPMKNVIVTTNVL